VGEIWGQFGASEVADWAVISEHIVELRLSNDRDWPRTTQLIQLSCLLVCGHNFGSMGQRKTQ